MPSDLPVQTQLDNLTARMTAIDGIGIPSLGPNPTPQGAMAQALALIAGLKKTLGNVNMGYQTEIGALNADYQVFKAAVNAILNL
jgi:hypothetical protein